MPTPTSTLILIRHAETKPIPGVVNTNWQLTPRGREACIALSETVKPFAPSVVATSHEMKAVQTGELITQALNIPMIKMPGLQEQERGGARFMATDSFRTAIRDLFDHPTQLTYGTETAEAAYQRFVAALNRVLHDHYDVHQYQQSIAVISHATVISLFVARMAKLDGFTFWSSLGMPAMITFSLPDLRLDKVINNFDSAYLSDRNTEFADTP